jgi:hypothetical protein
LSLRRVNGWGNRVCNLVSDTIWPLSYTANTARSRIAYFWGDTGGNVAMVTALVMPALVGVMGLGGEVGFWYYRQQTMQSAADSAAVAAASASGSSFEQEARGVAAKYGFIHGQGNVSIETQKITTCPAAPSGLVFSECYRVTVTSLVPLFLSRIVGYNGNAAVQVGDQTVSKTQLVSTSVAARVNTDRKYCIVALGSAEVDVDVDLNGSPKADLKGCGIMSNEGMKCVGNAEKVAEFADSPTGDTSPCGQASHTLPSQKIADPYAVLADNIPDQACSTTNVLSAPPTTTLVSFCGDVTVPNNVTITAQTVIVIKNGKLILEKKAKLKGLALTIIFTGNGGYVDGMGSLDITAPTSGDWKGVALYQDPDALQVAFTAAGSNLELIVRGIFYFPKADVTLSGAVNKDVSPAPCLVMMVGSFRVNGGGFFADSTQCSPLMDTMPSKQRGRLVS